MTRYLSVRRQIEGALPTAAEILRGKQQQHAFQLLTGADIEFLETGLDNWNGGTELWTARLRVPVAEFIRIEDSSETLCEKISTAIATVLGEDCGFWVKVEIAPKRIDQSGRANLSGKIEKRTRVVILDELQARDFKWYGDSNEVEFLERLYELEKLPSYDSRYDNARQDIYQHCINNDDWPMNWVYTDDRFNIYNCPQDEFLAFICEVLHPAIRHDAQEQKELAEAFNGHLAREGWELVEDRVINGLPAYTAEQRIHGLGAASQRAQAVAASINADALYKELERLHRIGDSDPGAAIGCAKDLVEGCCKYVLQDRGVEFSEKAEIPELLKKLRSAIKIMPKEIPEDAKAADNVRDVLQSLGNIAHSLAPIRNAYGSGHGRGRGFKSLEPRHARLAVGAATTFVDFVLDRHLSLPDV